MAEWLRLAHQKDLNVLANPYRLSSKPFMDYKTWHLQRLDTNGNGVLEK